MTDDVSTYVMIPAAWHGAWSWWPVAKRLRAAGHRAVCLDLPGMGDGDDPAGLRLQDAVDHVVSEVKKLDTDQVTLVAHSWAGYPMAGAAHQLAGKVAEVVFYNAHVPVSGRSMIEDNPPEGAEMLRGLIEASPNRAIYPTLAFVQQIFMPDVAVEAQRLVADLLTQQPGDYFLDALDIPEMITLGISARYILGADDHAMPRTGAEFAARLGLEPIMVPGTHEGLLTHPDEVAEAILNG